MIRRIFTLIVFCATVSLAAYGQDIFGRQDLVKLAHRVQAESPQRAQKVWHETDRLMASLSPEAGSDTPICTFESLDWATSLYQ